MATDTTVLEGQVTEDTSQERDVEALLAGFLRALLEEQKAISPEATQ